MLAEGLAISLLGCGAGLLLAKLAMIGILKLPDGTIPRADSIAIHWTIVLALGVIAALTTVLSSLLPALLVGRVNPQAALQAACKSEEMYLIVIGDAKSTVPNITLPQHHQLTREHMLQKMEDSSASQPVSLTIAGHPALQDEVSGTQSGAHLTFLHTTVDADDSFQQILAWTLKSRWQKQKDELREVTNSFQSEK